MDLYHSTKGFHIFVMKHVINLAVRQLEVQKLTITTLALLNLVLTLEFRLKWRNKLATELNKFVLGQHVTMVRKLMQYQTDQQKFVSGIKGAPYISDVDTLTVPYRVYPSYTHSVDRQWTRDSAF